MTTYPTPTTDADEFVAGMVAAHEGDTDENWRREVAYLKAVIRDITDIVLADDSGLDAASRGKVWSLARRASPFPKHKAHFEVLNEAMDEQP